jgi:hypothetical protein
MLRRKPTRVEIKGDRDDTEDLLQTVKAKHAKNGLQEDDANDPGRNITTRTKSVDNRIGYTQQQLQQMLNNAQ